VHAGEVMCSRCNQKLKEKQKQKQKRKKRKQNKTKQNKTKQNKTKQNGIQNRNRIYYHISLNLLITFMN
jgi:uncharacterized Zn finger protein (UPF0148 family)